jgi:hypothetical protein
MGVSERLRYVQLDAQPSKGDRWTTHVHLDWRGKRVVGASEGPKAQLLRCAARATADALRVAVGAHVSADVQTVEVFDATAAVVALSIHYRNETRRSVGICRVNDDPAEAVAKAVLNGTNRFIQSLTEGASR